MSKHNLLSYIEEGDSLKVALALQPGSGAQKWNIDAALMIAITYGNTDVVAVLLGAGADINSHAQLASIGNAPVLYAFANKDTSLEMTEFLLNNGLDLGVKYEEYGNTSLHHLALKVDALDVWDIALALNPDLECGNGSGNTPLHLAVIRNSWALAKHLLKAGANIHSRNYGGNSILHSYILNHRSGTKLENVVNIIGLGVNVNLKNDGGYTALDLMYRENVHSDVIGALQNAMEEGA